jgi:hypothetical protein
MGFLSFAPGVIHDGCRPPRKALAVALEDAICWLMAGEGRGFGPVPGGEGGIVLYSPCGRLVAKRRGVLGDCRKEARLISQSANGVDCQTVLCEKAQGGDGRGYHTPLNGEPCDFE